MKLAIIRKTRTAPIENKLLVKMAVLPDSLPLAISLVIQNPTTGSNKIT